MIPKVDSLYIRNALTMLKEQAERLRSDNPSLAHVAVFPPTFGMPEDSIHYTTAQPPPHKYTPDGGRLTPPSGRVTRPPGIVGVAKPAVAKAVIAELPTVPFGSGKIHVPNWANHPQFKELPAEEVNRRASTWVLPNERYWPKGKPPYWAFEAGGRKHLFFGKGLNEVQSLRGLATTIYQLRSGICYLLCRMHHPTDYSPSEYAHSLRDPLIRSTDAFEAWLLTMHRHSWRGNNKPKIMLNDLTIDGLAVGQDFTQNLSFSVLDVDLFAVAADTLASILDTLDPVAHQKRQAESTAKMQATIAAMSAAKRPPSGAVAPPPSPSLPAGLAGPDVAADQAKLGETSQQMHERLVAKAIRQLLENKVPESNITRDKVARLSGVSAGTVSGTTAWKAHANRKKQAAAPGPSPSDTLPSAVDGAIDRGDWEAVEAAQNKELRRNL